MHSVGVPGAELLWSLGASVSLAVFSISAAKESGSSVTELSGNSGNGSEGLSECGETDLDLLLTS